MKNLDVNKVKVDGTAMPSQFATVNSQFLIQNQKIMKTKSINFQMKPTLFQNVGLEKFKYYLESIYRKTNGKPLISYKNYGKYLSEAIQKLNIDPKTFSNTTSIFHLNIWRKLLEDIYGLRKHDKKVQNLFCVFDHYITFVKWCNNLNTPEASYVSVTPMTLYKAAKTYANAA